MSSGQWVIRTYPECPDVSQPAVSRSHAGEVTHRIARVHSRVLQYRSIQIKIYRPLKCLLITIFGSKSPHGTYHQQYLQEQNESSNTALRTLFFTALAKELAKSNCLEVETNGEFGTQRGCSTCYLISRHWITEEGRAVVSHGSVRGLAANRNRKKEPAGSGRSASGGDAEGVRRRRREPGRRYEGEAPQHEEAHPAREGRVVEQLLQHPGHQRRVLLQQLRHDRHQNHCRTGASRAEETFNCRWDWLIGSDVLGLGSSGWMWTLHRPSGAGDSRL